MTGWPAGSIWFACTGPAEWDAGERRWRGELKVCGHGMYMAELIIYGRGSCMNVLIGKYRSGQYICIPDIDVGCPLSRLSDVFWNKQRLSAHMQEADAVTVTYALKALSEYLGTDWL